MKDKIIRAVGPSWRRPEGPLNVWRVIDGEQKLEDGTTRALKFSIQEVPQDRQEEAVEFMLEYFLHDEPINKCLNLKDDEKAIHDLRITWDYCLAQGIVEAAYVLDTTNDEITELAAVNMLWVGTDETEKEMNQLQEKYQSAKFLKIIEVMGELSKKADVRKIFGVDKYIAALGLTVAHKFRGQKLGLRMLEARNNIGKKYEIPATSTVFTARSSQVLAERAGFTTQLIQNFLDIPGEDGKPYFAGIESKDMRVMTKRLY